jgi:hypothetical protein
MELTGLFCDGAISPEQAARLEKLVAESADARQYVQDTFQVHCELAWEFGRGGGNPPMRVRGIFKGDGRAFAGIYSTAETNKATGGIATTRTRWRRWLPFAVAAGVVAATTLVALTALRPPRRESHAIPAAVAHIEKVNGVRWRNSSAAEIAIPLPAGRILSIEQGLAQVRLESGAAIIVQGPAEIELRSPNSVALRSGSLTADVPPKARGFEVHTPNATLIDLGTRFGVACEAGQTDVEVFNGNVLLRPDVRSADRSQELRLAAHEAMRVSGTPGAGLIQTMPRAAGSRNFVQSVDDCYPHVAPACACPDVPAAAAELIGPWHCPQGKLISVDLSRQANWSNLQSTPDRVRNSLVELSLGPRSLAGVNFQIASGLIQLHGVGLPNQARSVSGIPVGRRVTRLYILQGAQFCGPEYGVHEGELLAEYRLRFAGARSNESTRATIPVAYGKDVRDWWAGGPQSPLMKQKSGVAVTRGQVAWAGHNPETRHDKTYLHLYLCTWENPHPEKILESIDYVALHDSAGPFCVAITAEESPPAYAPAHADVDVNR